MLPDLFQAHNRPRALLRREECWTRFSPSLVGPQILRIPPPLSNPLDGVSPLRLLRRRRCLEAHCRPYKAHGHVLEFATNIQQIPLLFSLVVFLSIFITLLIPDVLSGKKNSKRSRVWLLAGGLCTSSDVIHLKSNLFLQDGLITIYLHLWHCQKAFT
jgi:hypothetical protein